MVSGRPSKGTLKLRGPQRVWLDGVGVLVQVQVIVGQLLSAHSISSQHHADDRCHFGFHQLRDGLLVGAFLGWTVSSWSGEARQRVNQQATVRLATRVGEKAIPRKRVHLDPNVVSRLARRPLVNSFSVELISSPR